MKRLKFAIITVIAIVLFPVAICAADNEAPEWVEYPSFIERDANTSVTMHLKASDNVGIVSYRVTIPECATPVENTVTSTTLLDEDVTVYVTDFCMNEIGEQGAEFFNTFSFSTLTIVAIDAEGNESRPAYISFSGCVLRNAECNGSGEEYIILAVETRFAEETLGSADEIRVKCSSPVIEKDYVIESDGTIKIEGLQPNNNYTFDLWALNGGGKESVNSMTVTCSTAEIEPRVNIEDTTTPTRPTTMGNAVAVGDEVTMIAYGFDKESDFTWELQDESTSVWNVLQGETFSQLKVIPTAPGMYHYRVTGFVVDAEGTKSASMRGASSSTAKTDTTTKVVYNDLLVKVACHSAGLVGLQTIWSESFDRNFTNPSTDRFDCDSVKGYQYSSSGIINEGEYAIVANSDATLVDGWAKGKYDHTSGNGESGFLVINATQDRNVMYEFRINPAWQVCEGMYYNFSLFATNMGAVEDGDMNMRGRFKFEIYEKHKAGYSIPAKFVQDSVWVYSDSMKVWDEYGTSFQAVEVSDIEYYTIRIINTSTVLSGNDIAIDDISLSICMPTAETFIVVDTLPGKAGKKIETEVACCQDVPLKACIMNGNYTQYFNGVLPYYVWFKKTVDEQGSMLSDWEMVSCAYDSTYNYPTVNGEKARFKVLIASNKETADNILAGKPYGCNAYTWTDSVYVECVDKCTNPAKIDWVRTSGNPIQSLCNNDPVINIEFALEGSATDYKIEGLPEGVTATLDDSSSPVKVKIYGTPDRDKCTNDVYKYTVKTVGQDEGYCQPAMVSGSITLLKIGAEECGCPEIEKPEGKGCKYCKGKTPTPLEITSEVGEDYRVNWYDKEGVDSLSTGSMFAPQVPGTYMAKRVWILNHNCQSEGVVLSQELIDFIEGSLDVQYPAGSSAERYLVGDDEIDFQYKPLKGEPKGVEWYLNGVVQDVAEPYYFSKQFYTESKVSVRALGECNTVIDTTFVNVVWPTIIISHTEGSTNTDFVTGSGIELWLFDRVGNMVWHSTDGLPTEKAKTLQPTVYFYTALTPDGNVHKGTLEIYISK